MILLRCAIIAYCFLCFSPLLRGQDTLTLTYDVAVDIALKQSFTMKSFEKNEQSMQSYFAYYKANFKPRLDLNLYLPSWDEYVTEIQQVDNLPVYNSVGSMKFGGDLKFTYTLPTGGNLALASYSYREKLSTAFSSLSYDKIFTDQFYNRFAISFNQPLFTKNRLKEDLRVAELQYQKTVSTYSRAQMDIVFNVSDGFYALFRASKQRDIALQRMSNSKEAFRIAKLMNETGNIPEGDVLIAEITVSQDMTKYLEACSNLSREEDKLKQLIGLPLDLNIKVITGFEFNVYDIDLNVAVEHSLQSRLELNEKKNDIELQEIEVARAKREGRLKSTLSCYYDVTGLSTLGEGTTSELFQSSIDNLTVRPHNRGVTFTLALPIYDWGRSKALYMKQKFDLDEEKLALDNIKQNIVMEVRHIVRTVNENKVRLDIYKKGIEISNKSYLISQLRFSNGELTSQELAVEQARLAEIQLEYLNAYITYQMALADLKRKTMWDFQNNRSYNNTVQ